MSALVYKCIQFVTLDRWTMVTRDEWMSVTTKLLARQITQSLLFDPLQTRGTMKNPNELWRKDNQSFATVREYLHCLRTEQVNKAKEIYHANNDLRVYFDFVYEERLRNPYYAL